MKEAVLIDKNVKEKWKELLEEYESWTHKQLDPAYLESIRIMGRMFSELSKSEGKLVLDIGCGNGRYGGTNYEESKYSYVNYNCRYIGIDPLFGENRNFPFVQSVAEYLPFKSNIFDTVIMATSMDHFMDLDIALSECKRVLKPRGIFATATGVYEDANHTDPSHVYHLTRQSAFQATAKYFDVTHINYFEGSGCNSFFIRGLRRV